MSAYDDVWLMQQLLKPGYRVIEGAALVPPPLVAPDAPEADLQDRLQALCKTTDHLYYHALKSKGSTAGMVDAIIVPEHTSGTEGSTLYLWELKRDGEAPGLAQRRWHAALARVTRVEVAVLFPRDWPFIVATLTRRTL